MEHGPLGNSREVERLRQETGQPSYEPPQAPKCARDAYDLGYRHGYEDAFAAAWRQAQEVIEAVIQQRTV